MSVKEKQEKRKKASDVRSLRHVDKSAQSSSSLGSSYVEQLERELKRLFEQKQNANMAIKVHERRRDQYIGETDKFSREEAEYAQRSLQIWQEHALSIRTQMNKISDQLKLIYGSPQKPRKTKNYALKKLGKTSSQ